MEGREVDTRVSQEPEKDLSILWSEHGPRLWRAVLAYSGDREIANDAVAEAFAQCLGRGDAVRSPADWVWRAAFRLAAGELKRRGRWVAVVAEDIPWMPEPAADLVNALAVLPPKQRACLVLHYYSGYRAREVAEILGSTPATVRVHLSQGRRRLRRLLEGDDD
jgi:RNA polymerase sigma-70 factor (ECF subfamily)